MTPSEITHKLTMIRTLSAGEWQGWWGYIHASRAPFAGEIAAMHHRARQLNLTLPS